ncbi:aspartate carbamoyltransferase regulatory subunit [Methanolapillus ohkumae]|uniref:Aspartate carbamoyltransferase regulatory chain n=1 Tax=Methanolapillus ohkumae TaxID=3028298 RepID=A0AA96ZX61_9EURY|nr:Aspartate carbamoyltransferase regulatory chain [Methanosarcinaceae archaeon Am2]
MSSTPEKNEKSTIRSKKLGDKNDLRIKAIENGTVIDHITPGQALNVLRIISVGENFKNTVSIVMNAGGARGDKDVVKIEGKELTEKEVAAISLLSPKATVNIIRNFEVIEKKQVAIPQCVHGILKCVNPNCISNSKEPIDSRFIVKECKNGAIHLRCAYCESVMTENFIKNII